MANLLNSRIISENTLLPLSLIMSLLVFTFLFAQIYSLAYQNEAKINAVADEQTKADLRQFDQLDELKNVVGQLSVKTAHIDGKLDILLKRTD